MFLLKKNEKKGIHWSKNCIVVKKEPWKQLKGIRNILPRLDMFHSSGNEKFLRALFVASECPYETAFIGLAAGKKAEKRKREKIKRICCIFSSFFFFCFYEFSPLMHR